VSFLGLLKSFFLMGLIEHWESGTTRMAGELQAEGFPIPLFESTSGLFRVTFFKPLITNKNDEKQELSKRQLLAIEYIKEHGSISNTEYQNVANISRRTATRELKNLKLQHIVISSEEGQRGRGVIYFLKELEK
jgi:ATP-dependent DNA helicase RecG